MKCREDRIENVASEVAEGAIAKVLPITPTPRMIDTVPTVRTFRGDAKPKIPVERVRNSRRILWTIDVA